MVGNKHAELRQELRKVQIKSTVNDMEAFEKEAIKKDNERREKEGDQTEMASALNQDEMRIIDGKYFKVHKVDSSDTLNLISLKYNVSKKTLMLCNGLVSDQNVYQKREILIPIIDGFVMHGEKPESVSEVVSKETMRRKMAIKMMREFI